MCARRFACVNCRAHVRGTRVYMNLHNKKHGTYVDSAYTFFQFCPYPEDGLPIHCCSVSYSCDVSLRKLKLENCLCTGYFGSPFLPEREKEKALKSLNFRAFSFSPLRQKIAVLGSSHVAYSWDFLKAVFAPTN